MHSIKHVWAQGCGRNLVTTLHRGYFFLQCLKIVNLNSLCQGIFKLAPWKDLFSFISIPEHFSVEAPLWSTSWCCPTVFVFLFFLFSSCSAASLLAKFSHSCCSKCLWIHVSLKKSLGSSITLLPVKPDYHQIAINTLLRRFASDCPILCYHVNAHL